MILLQMERKVLDNSILCLFILMIYCAIYNIAFNFKYKSNGRNAKLHFGDQ